jgi:quercetin dioxygenase-like cupin family protein
MGANANGAHDSREISFRPQRADPLQVGEEAIVPLLDSDLGASKYEVFDAVGLKGTGAIPHAHPWDEGYVILEGELAVFGESSESGEELLRPGGSAFVPGGMIHGFEVRSDRCRYLIVTTPGAHAFYRDAEATMRGNTEDLEAMYEVAKRNRVTSPMF